jgi:hypothetical protein
VRSIKMFGIGLGVLAICLAVPRVGHSADFVVYSVIKALDMGNPGEVPQKDYYVNMGTAHGLNDGATLEVVRKVPTYDLESQKLYKDISFPIATLKVIHVESNAAVARLEKMNPPEKTPVTSPMAVMIGDFVRVTR